MKINSKMVRILSAGFLVFCMMTAFGTTAARAAGEDGISFTYNSATQTLTFSGKGRFANSYDLDERIRAEIYDKGKGVKKIILKEGFDSVGRYAFDTFYDVEEVELPDSVKKIGDDAFQYCSQLATIRLPKNLKKVGGYAFSGTALTKITLPDTVKKVGGGAFAYCHELEEVTFPADVVEAYTFSGCSSLEKIKFTGKLTEIGDSAFVNSGISEFKMPDTVLKMGEKAFAKSDIESIKLSKKLTVIPKGAFDHCLSLEQVSIGKKTESIEPKAFMMCTSLSDITFGKSLEFIGTKAFYKCSLGSITLPGSMKTLDYAALKDAGITDVTIEPGLEEIGDWAFQKNPMTGISIPDTVTTIQMNAFANCRELTTIDVDEANPNYSSAGGMLLSRDGTRLYVCPAGYSGTAFIPATVTTLNEYSFNKCRKITAFAIGSATVSGNSGAFQVRDGVLTDSTGQILVHYPAGLTGDAVIPAGITSIADYAFEDSVMSAVKIPDTVTSIGIAAFIHCENLKQIIIPANVKTLSAACFWGCTGLEKVTMESGVENIRRSCFNNCKNLAVVRIPTSVKSIAKTAFYNTSWDMTIYASKQSFALAFAKKNYYKYRVV